jgi:hypothetical protein
VVVDKVKDLSVAPGKLRETMANDSGAFRFEPKRLSIFGRVRNVMRLIQVLVDAATPDGSHRFMASDGENPGQDLGAALEAVGMLPHFEKGLTDQMLGERPVVDRSEHVTEYADVIRAVSARMA